MKFGVNKKILLYTAGCVWIFAGINILRIGIVTWLNDTHYWLFKIGEATIVFLLFFNLVFKRLFYKHSERINSAAFLPLISMPPKIGPVRKLPLTPLAAIPETNNPG